MRKVEIWSEMKIKRSERRRKRSENCHHFRFEAKWSETEAKFFSFDARKVFFACFRIKRNENEKKRKRHEKEAKTSKQKRIKWNSGKICKETKKSIKVGLLVFQVYTKWSEKKRKDLFRFASKRNKVKKTFISFYFEAKIGSETKWNKKFLAAKQAKVRWTNFATVGSEKFPLKAVMKMIQFQTFKYIWAHSPNTRNESVRILRIRGMNLFVYWEYAERICTYSENTRNELNIRSKFCCSYTENTRKESVRILRIRGMNLFVYWEYAEWICAYTENTRNARKFEYLGKFETKIENILGCLSGA